MYKYAQNAQQQAPGYRQTAQQPYQRQRPATPAPAPAPQSFAPQMPAHQSASVAPTPVQQPALVQNHTPNQQAPGTVPQYQQPAPAQQSKPNPTSNADEYISRKVYKSNGKDKVIDFTEACVSAYMKDYANIHGCGGKGHARNSTIAVTICDYKEGTGPNSVSASFNIDVERMDELYQASVAATLGNLHRSPYCIIPEVMKLHGIFNQWETASQNFVAVAENELVDAGSELGGAVTQQTAAPKGVLNRLRRWLKSKSQWVVVPIQAFALAKKIVETLLDVRGRTEYSYCAEKNNPYKWIDGIAVKAKTGDLVPVSKIQISYIPVRQDGEISSFPWIIQITNFNAPITVWPNGASSHNSKSATDIKTVFINLSAQDFHDAMVAVRRFLDVWENKVGGAVVGSALKAQAAQQEAKKNGQTA